ncbi:MAG TPA: DUF6502 family protein [Gammaproteobacteria bacterium]
MSAINPERQVQPSQITPQAWAFVARVMRPVIRIVLRMGFSAEQISQMVRKLAVDAAMEHPEFRPPHRKRAFIAHAAVVTGLSRKEVSKLHEIDELQDALDTCQVNRSMRVLGGWINDHRYRDPVSGRPLATLPFKASSGVSFHQLVREYGGDVPPRSVLDALIQKGALDRQGNRIELLQSHPAPPTDSEEEVEVIGMMLGDALNTAEHDLRPGTPRRLFRQWYQEYVPDDRLAEAQAIIREETWAFGEALDERLAGLAHRAPKANTRYHRLGLGAYYFQGESDTERE